MPSLIPTGDRYTCAACGGTFDKICADDDVMAESLTLWGEMEASDMCVVCDDCFERGKAEALIAHHADMKRN